MNMMATQDERFARWLREQIEKHGWTNRELARRAGISHVTISKITSPTDPKAPREEVARKLAVALEVSDVMVFRLAGLLKQVPHAVEMEEELISYYRQLPRVVRELLVEIIKDTHKYLSLEANMNRLTEGLALDPEVINDLRFLLATWSGLPQPQREELLAKMVVTAGRSHGHTKE